MSRQLERVQTHINRLRAALMDLAPKHVGDTAQAVRYTSLLAKLDSFETEVPDEFGLVAKERRLLVDKKRAGAISAIMDRTGGSAGLAEAAADVYLRSPKRQ